MDAYLDQVLPNLSDAQQLAVVVAAGVVLLAVIALIVALVVRRRRRRPTPIETPADGEVIRRPVYVDPLLLDDLLGHVETRDFSGELNRALEIDDPDRRPTEVRKLNKVLVGLRQRSDLLHDLDREPETELQEGQAIIATGTLTRLPASDAAELIELAAPLLVHAANGHGPDIRSQNVGVKHPPLALRLDPSTGGDRRYLVVLDHDGLWTDLPASHPGDRSLPSGPVTVLGIVDGVLGARDRISGADVLGPELSYEVRESLRDRDLGTVATTLSNLTDQPLKERELDFEGPGARIGVAAIYR